MSSNAIETAFPLTALQQAVVLASVRDPEGSPYRVQCQVDLLGALDPDRLAEVWRRLIRRHPALRSFFAWEGREEPLQVIRSDAPLPWTFLDWSRVEPREQERRWTRLRADDAGRSFDLSRAPVLRFTLVRLGEERHRLLWSVHHALADGWSALRVLQEMVEEYDALHRGVPRDAPAPPSFGVFVSWLAGRDREAAREYWEDRLRGLRDGSPLPAPRRRPPGPDRETVELELGRELSAGMAEAAARLRVTPYTLLLGAWSLVLHRHAPEDDSITFGTTVTERPAEIPGVEHAVGMFLNTVPLRIPAPGNRGLADWLEIVQRRGMEARHHGVGGLPEIGRWAELEPGASLARSLVVYESFPDDIHTLPEGDSFRLEGLKVSAPSDLPLALLGHPGESARLELAYDPTLYTEESARRLLSLTGAALRGLSDPGIRTVDQVELLDPEEERLLVDEWSRSPVPEPPSVDVLDAFDNAVAAAPDAAAVVDGEGPLSYRELDRAANRLAHRILGSELPRDALLGIPGWPTVQTVVSILACLKAGHGYVPFDPSQPEARRTSILELVDGVLASEGDGPRGLRHISLAGLDGEPDSPPAVERDPDRTAYVIFTSGSTGRPKGVVVERGQLARSTAARRAWYQGSPERFLLLSSLAVDSSVAGLYWSLCTGGCLVLPPHRAEQDAEGLAGLIEGEGVTTTLLVPSLWRTLLDEVDPARLDSLECVVVAGEACPPTLVGLHHRRLPGVRLVNEYGPSEVTVWATAAELHPDPDEAQVTIGRPVPFVRVYLLDEDGRPVPRGAAGEICLGGGTVARGYLHADEAAADRFVADPFVPGSRMYRTGDRGRFREDGRLDFLGRLDDQMKIRGYRVEPGEIEAVLDTAPRVSEAAVVLDGPSPPGELVAVLQAECPSASLEAVRDHARARLPAHMVPTRFELIPSLPRTPAGKLDRRALAGWVASRPRAPESGHGEDGATRAPATDAERILAGIWASVLGLETVSVDEDFFRLGGDSLLSIRVIARAKQAGLTIAPQQFFATPTIAALAAAAAPESGRNGSSEREAHPPGDPGAAKADALPSRGDRRAPLSFAQRRFWVVDRLHPGDPAYNVSLRIDLRGPLGADRLARSFREVIDRHDALRGLVRLEDGVPWLDVLPPERFALERTDFSGLPDREARMSALSREMARHRFDLLEGPLVRGVLVRLSPDRHALLLTFHHMVLDGESVRLVLEDLGAAYRVGDEAGWAEAEAISYRDYAAWEEDRWERQPTPDASLRYWTELLAEVPERIDWPPDEGASMGDGTEGATERRTLPLDLAEAVDRLARSVGCTPFVILLSAYHVLLHRHVGQDVVVVGTPVGHRPHPALERAVGYYQNLLPLRADLAGDPTFAELVTRVRETVSEALARADVPFERIVEATTPRRDPTVAPFFQTALTFRDATRPEHWRSALDLPGVSVETEVLHNGGAKFEVGLEIERTEDGFTLLAEYSRDRFGADTVSALLHRFEVLLRGALDAPHRPVSALPVMTQEERRETLGPWRDGGATGGVRAFVLDERGHPVPPGVPGELCIAGLPWAGDGAARAGSGPDRVRPARFPEAAGEVLYQTGDRVRLRRDGTLAFLDRPAPPAATEAREPMKAGLAGPAAAPAPGSAAGSLPKEGEPPRPEPPEGPVESAIAAVWAQVLETRDVGRYDDFFALGGHSLKAISVLVRLEEALGVELPLADFFESPTVAGLAARVASTSRPPAARPSAATPGEGRDGPRRYPLSPDQSRLWYLHQLDPESSAYHVPTAWRLEGRLELPALQKALDELVRRHDALRTTFDGSGSEPVQVVHPPAPVPLTVTDVPPETEDAAIQEMVEAETTDPFDLERGPLLRCRLIRRGEAEQVLVLTVHHLVADGWSLGLMAREISTAYARALDGAAARVDGPEADPATRAGDAADAGSREPAPLRWGPWCAKQREGLESGNAADDLAFWRSRLRDVPPLELPADHPRPDRPSYRGRTHAFHLSTPDAEGLERRCRAAGVTPFAGLLSAFKLLLHRYSGQTDLAVGSVVAGRSSVASEEIVGLFANTVVLRTEIDPSGDVDGLLRRVGQNSVEALAHHRAPFAAVVEAVQPPRDPSRNPLFQVAFLLQSQDSEPLDLPGLASTEIPVDTGTAKFDLTLYARREADGYAFRLEYASDLFEAETVERMSEHFRTLVRGMADDPSAELSSLPMVRDPGEWCLSGPVQVASGEPLHARVSGQARRTPEAVAVRGENGEAVDYRELDIRSHRIAVALVARGIGVGDVVGVGLPRTPDLVATLLGILKAGAAYLPLDPDFPAPRLQHIVESAGASLLVTTEDLQGRFPPGPPVVLLSTLLGDTLTGAEDEARPHAPAFPVVEPEATAYLIYTSGSTGGPKGVEVTHGNAVNLLDTMAVRPGLDGNTCWLAVTTLSFDISLLEIFGPLLVGGEVVLASTDTAADGRALHTLMERVRPTHLQATPSTWRMLLDVGWEGDGDLKALVGGEALPPELARELAGPCREVWNMYGPTETTVWSTCGRVDGSEGPIQVGTPVANTTVYVLDPGLQPVPRGVPGELYIAGAGVAAGYRGRPELTAERFLPDPFAGSGARMYRTGDRVRLLADGTLEVLGRLDGQVKIRGFRIETGEVEGTLEEHPAVRRAVVRAFGTGGPDARLVAFVVPDPNVGISGSEVRRFARERLPRYMVPSMISLLDELPLTPNGKVDRQALLDPLEAGRPETASHEPPVTQAQRTIAQIWSELLGGVEVGRGDNFFELGGHSLLSIRAVAEIRRRTGHELDPRAFFFQSVEQLASELEEEKKEEEVAP